MELFQDIPQVIQANILCNWLKPHDVSRLDSALCSNIFRPQFLSVLRSGCVFPSLDTDNEEQAGWVLARSIGVRELTLRHNKVVSNREKLLNHLSQSLTDICLCTEDCDEEDESPPVNIDEMFFDVAMLCPMIQVLSAWDVVVSNNLNLVVLKCIRLKSLNISSCSGITNGTIKSICSAPTLSFLNLEESQFQFDTPDFSTYKSPSIRELNICNTKLSRAGRLNLCACFPFLTYLSVGPVCGDDVVTIADCCPNVETAYVRIEGTLTDENATLLCKHWAHIELLWLERDRKLGLVCSEQAVLNLLHGCPALLKLSVCHLDYPHTTNTLYGSDACSTSERSTHITTSLSTSTTKVTTSKVTDLFLDTLSEATLRIIITLCPQLNTLAVRHSKPVKPTHKETNDQLRAAEYALSCLNHPTCSVRKLHMHNIRSLTGADLLSLTCLEELQLSNIGTRLNNEMLLSVVKNNPNLRSISLYNCEFLRSRSLILPLLKIRPALHTFNFTEASTLVQIGRSSFSSARLILEDVIRDQFPNIKTLNLNL